ncbi:MAG: Type 1 glutamine amidotransferase-like domain-containing protein [Alphaproteobacteria bacterium]|nr:Type 1 glutamine amidotransferase-like domain-containing protein [Alphaproteobacteria bacterium]
MKAILASQNITNIPGGVELVERMVGKPRDIINIAVINEASAIEFGNHRWAIDTLSNLAATFGGSIEFVHLLAITPEQIFDRVMAADMVFVLGGSADWQKVVFDKSGFSKIVPEILRDKLYVGSSAGSMILGRRPSNETLEKLYRRPIPNLGVTSYLDIFDFSILPHLDDDELGAERNQAIAESRMVDYPVYALSDHAAIVVDNDNISVIGDGYIKLQK